MLKKIIAFLILVLVLVIPTQVAHALNVPPAPSQTAILDQARVIDDAKEAEISQKLIDYKSKTGNEIAVLTIQSLKGEEAFDYSHRVASEWGVGSKEANNGVLLFVAAEDRQIFIQVGEVWSRV